MVASLRFLTIFIYIQTSIDELSPSKQPTAELSSYADDLESLILKIENLGLPPSDILKQCVNLIRKDVVTLTQVDAEASKLRDAFIGVQNRRNLTAGIEDLVKGIEETKKVRGHFNPNAFIMRFSQKITFIYRLLAIRRPFLLQLHLSIGD